VVVVQHCFGARGKGGRLKDLKHFKKLQYLLVRAEDKNALTALTDAIKAERKRIDNDSLGLSRSVGATLPAVEQAERAQVVLDLWALGIPLRKMGQKKMQALVEKPRSSLGGLSGLKAVQKVAINSVFQKAPKCYSRYIHFLDV
jgi:hypothetical protein